jgi:hypothetical protein
LLNSTSSTGIFLQDYTQFFWHKLIRTSPSILLQWQKFAASTEEYENQIARQTTAVTRSEFAKASAEEKLVMMIGEQVKMHPSFTLIKTQGLHHIQMTSFTEGKN